VGDIVQGEITEVDLVGTPRHIVVRDDNGDAIQVRVHVSTQIAFSDSRDAGLSPELSNLKPGMRVRLRYNGDERAERIEVMTVPESLRRDARRTPGGLLLDRDAERGSRWGDRSARDGQDLKVRLLDVKRNGEIRADVAGQTRTFRVEDPKALARFGEGDLVIVTVANAGAGQQVVTDIRSAALAGRVSDIDSRNGMLHVLVNGREESFRIERPELMNVRVGDRIHFETEERANGERVIVQLRRDD
jgi:Cu/Ag efflux protein CusF